MQTSAGVYVFFMLACAIAFLAPLLRGGLLASLRWQPGPMGLQRLKFGLPVMLALYALATFFKLEAVGGFPWFLAAYLACWALSCLALSPWLRGVVLLLAAFAALPPSGIFAGAESAILALLSALFGLLAARLGQTAPDWEDLTLPATLLIGAVWVGNVFPDPAASLHWNLLLALLAVSLLLRTLAGLPTLLQAWNQPPGQDKTHPSLLQPVFLVITGFLAAWLAVQALLPNPALLRWVPLYAGGLILACLLPVTPPGNAVEPSPSGASPDSESAVAALSDRDAGDGLLSGLVQLVLIGIAALVASRLFGGLGWLVLAVALVLNIGANVRSRQIVGIAALFFLGRSLLQVFLYQHNPNVTGVNITHPYASAALYAGFIAMMALPAIANRMAARRDNTPATVVFTAGPLGWALLLAAVALSGGLANYFLHAEATGSLLTALLVAGLGVSLAASWRLPELSSLPLPLAMLVTSGALLFADLIGAGSEAEKTRKVLVLAGSLGLIALVLFLLRRACPLSRMPQAEES